MKHAFSTRIMARGMAVALFVCMSFAPPAAADGNQIYLLQAAPDAGGFNTALIDQRHATNGLVQGISNGLVPTGVVVPGTPAVQFGGENSLEIDLRGHGNEVQLSQQGLPLSGTLTPGFGNTALIIARGTDQLAMLSQMGDGNSAEITLRQRDAGSTAELYQFGDGNTGALRVRGDDTRGVLIQNGTNLDSALTVRARGAEVRYRLNGSNVAAPGGVVVMTNVSSGGPITITQTQ